MAISVRGDADLAAASLVSNLERVQKGEAFGLDEKGDLIGEAVKGSFRGKVVDLLVRAGIAKEGNLGGRLATSLLGKDNFNLILEARKNPRGLEKSTVVNALNLLERIQKHASKADFVKRNVAIETVWSNMSANTPLRKLTSIGNSNGGKIHAMLETLRNEVFPQRQAQRQAVIDQVAVGKPTAPIQKAEPDELRAAYRLIEKGAVTGERALENEDANRFNDSYITRDQKGGAARGQAVLNDYNRAAALIRGQAAAQGENPSARLDAFKAQYLSAVQGEFERRDVEDGQRLRIDGQGSAPLKSEGQGPSTVRFGGIGDEGSRGEQVRTYSPRDTADTVREPTGNFERPAFPGVDTQIGRFRPQAQETLDDVREFLQAYDSDDFAQLDELAADLESIMTTAGTEPGQKAEAADLALQMLSLMSAPRELEPEAAATAAIRPALCESLPGMVSLLTGLQTQTRTDPEIAGLVGVVDADIRKVAEADRDRVNDMVANPEQYPEFFEAYEDAFSMEVAVQEEQPTLRAGHRDQPGGILREGNLAEPSKPTLTVASAQDHGKDVNPLDDALDDLEAVGGNADQILKLLDSIGSIR